MTAPARAASEAEVPFLLAALDRVVERLDDAAHGTELVRARAEFADRRGRVFEDEPTWEEWTQAFLEWAALERAWHDGAAPAARAFAVADGRVRAALGAWLTSQRALARIDGLAPGRVELTDLLGGASFVVSEERALHGVQLGDLVEVRLVGFEGAVRFGRTFVYHPPAARDAVTARARALTARGLARGAVLDALAALRTKVERYRHVDPARVYEADDAAELARRGVERR